jgi:hypothetical protein
VYRIELPFAVAAIAIAVNFSKDFFIFLNFGDEMLSDVSSVVIRHLRNSVTKWKTGENIRYFSFKEFTDHEISVPISFTHRHTHTKRWRLRLHAQLINWNSFFFFYYFEMFRLPVGWGVENQR